jgi:hypothetical protein
MDIPIFEIENRRIDMYVMRFHLLTATSMKMAVFWDVVLYSLVYTKWCFRGVYCFHNTLMMMAVRSSETSVISTRLHTTTSQKIAIFINVYMAVDRNFYSFSKCGTFTRNDENVLQYLACFYMAVVFCYSKWSVLFLNEFFMKIFSVIFSFLAFS